MGIQGTPLPTPLYVDYPSIQAKPTDAHKRTHVHTHGWISKSSRSEDFGSAPESMNVCSSRRLDRRLVQDSEQLSSWQLPSMFPHMYNAMFPSPWLMQRST